MNIVEWFNDDRGKDLGIKLADISGGLSKIGYKDGNGLLQGTYSLEYFHGDVDVGISTDYMGIKALGSCVTAEAKIRAIEFAGKRFYFSFNVDILSLGVKAGINPEKNRLEIGASLGVGAGLSVSWEDVECCD